MERNNLPRLREKSNSSEFIRRYFAGAYNVSNDLLDSRIRWQTAFPAEEQSKK